MRRHILIAMVGLTMFGCGEQNSLDNIEFVKRNLKNKNLHEKLLTTEQSQNRSAEHQSLFQTINNSYNLLQQSKTETDPFKAYKLAFTARQTFYSKEADSQAILSAKKLPDITALYRRIEPYFAAAPNTDFFYKINAEDWDIFSVMEQVKYSANILHAVNKTKTVMKHHTDTQLRTWLNQVITKQNEEFQFITYILVQASETQKDRFYTDKKPIEKNAERILASVSPKQARQMLKPDIYAWQQDNLWRYELVFNTCSMLDEKIVDMDVAKDCRLLLNTYKDYTIEPDEFDGFALTSRVARNQLLSLIKRFKKKYNYSPSIKKSMLKPELELNKLFTSLKKDFYRTTYAHN